MSWRFYVGIIGTVISLLVYLYLTFFQPVGPRTWKASVQGVEGEIHAVACRIVHSSGRVYYALEVDESNPAEPTTIDTTNHCADFES